jgi:hypothetical protein
MPKDADLDDHADEGEDRLRLREIEERLIRSGMEPEQARTAALLLWVITSWAASPGVRRRLR